MKKGFYFTRWPNKDGKLINYWKLAKPNVNVYMDWELGLPTPLLIGKKMWVDIGMYKATQETEAYVTKVLTALKPKARKIIAFEMRDEPPWNQAKTQAKALMVKKVMKQLGYPPIPVGATYHEGHILEGEHGEGWKAPALDWLGLEAYIDYIPGELPAVAAKRMESHINRLLAKVGPSKRIIMVSQAYNRNTTWKDNASLVAVQEPAFKAAKALGPRLIMLGMFAFARAKSQKTAAGTVTPPVSTIDIPPLWAEIKRLTKVYQ